LTSIRSLTGMLAIGLFAVGMVSGALAQQPASQSPQLASESNWTFNIAPYLWLPSINATLNYNLPPALGGKLPTETSSGPGDYLPHLNFAGMVTADARYGRFSMLTDFMYLNLSTSQTNIRSLNFFGLPLRPISRSLELGTSSTLHSAIWTLAGGYTLVEGNCGNFSVIAGLRYADVDFKTDYNLALTVTGPRGNGATFGGPGSISGGGHLWNGIAGFRGHIRLGETGLFIPYYFDIGAGGSNLTWQIASGIGYQTGWASVSALYRHLSFEQDNSATIRHLSLGGPLVMATFRF